MYNDLFSIGPVTVHGYGLCIGLGTVLALLLAWHRAEKRGIPSEQVTELGALVLICGFIGAKLLFVINTNRDPLETLHVRVKCDFSTVEELGADGAFHPVKFTREGDVLVFARPLACYEFTALRCCFARIDSSYLNFP